MIALYPIGITSIRAQADAMFLIAKGEVIGDHRASCGMPEVNTAASIIIGNIIEDMPSGVGMVNGMHILAQFGVGIANVKDDVRNNIIVVGLIIAIGDP